MVKRDSEVDCHREDLPLIRNFYVIVFRTDQIVVRHFLEEVLKITDNRAAVKTLYLPNNTSLAGKSQCKIASFSSKLQC